MSQAKPAPATGPQTWLILQGLGTDFQAVLTDKLLARGDHVVRVYYCGGDWLFRGRDEAVFCTVPRSDLKDFYARLLAEKKPAGIILFGDRRAIHKPVFEVAGDTPIYVLEEGYIRPGYICFERGGTNAHSPLPKDPAIITDLAAEADEEPPVPALPPSMRRRVIMDLRHVWGTFWLRKRFPLYQTHRPYKKSQEALGWLMRLGRRPWVSRRSRRRWQRTKDTRFFFFPLQLNADTQIHAHSPFGSVLEVIDAVLASFAAHAPGDCRLLIKNHPLDNGVLGYGSHIKREARRLGLEGRVVYVDGGNAGPMIARSQGVVLVNSTVGLSALIAGKPVKPLGRALYDIDGMTDPQPLDSFWQAPKPPDATLVSAFLKMMKAGSLVEGDLFTPQGIDLATDAIVAVLAGDRPRLVRQDGRTRFSCQAPK